MADTLPRSVQVPDWVALDLTLQRNTFYNPRCPRDVGLSYGSTVGTRELFVDITRNYWRDAAGVLGAAQIMDRVLDGRSGGMRPLALVEPFLLVPPEGCASGAPTTTPPAAATPTAPPSAREASFTFNATGAVQNLTLPAWATGAQCGSVEAMLWGAAGGTPPARTAQEAADNRVGSSGAGGFTRVVLPAAAPSLYIWVGTGGRADSGPGWPDGGPGHNGYRRSGGGGGGSRIAWEEAPSAAGILGIAGGGGGAGPYTPSHAGGWEGHQSTTRSPHVARRSAAATRLPRLQLPLPLPLIPANDHDCFRGHTQVPVAASLGSLPTTLAAPVAISGPAGWTPATPQTTLYMVHWLAPVPSCPPERQFAQATIWPFLHPRTPADCPFFHLSIHPRPAVTAAWRRGWHQQLLQQWRRRRRRLPWRRRRR